MAMSLMQTNMHSSRKTRTVNSASKKERGSSGGKERSKTLSKQEEKHNYDDDVEQEDDDPLKLLSKESDPSKVYCIDFHGKKLQKIAGVEKYPNCKSIDFSCNQVKEIPLLDKNTEICELKLYSNEISQIKGLKNLRKLQNLQLQHNNIKEIGEGLKGLKNLKILRLGSNKLSYLESTELKTCSSLTYLDLNNNNIKSLNCLNVLPCLEELYLAWNQLEKFPDTCSCIKLQEIDLSHNHLTNVSGLKNLPKLTIVNVSNNHLQDLTSLSSSKSLQQLDASGNLITDLLHISQQFPNLEVLAIGNNSVPRWKEVVLLKCLRGLKELYLEGNPVKNDIENTGNWNRRIVDILPQLEVLDGVQLTRPQSRSGELRPMRPMTASQGISTRMIADQINVMQHELSLYQDIINSKFSVLHEALGCLPTKSAVSPRQESESKNEKQTHETHAQSTPSIADARPVSRCGGRTRIQEALAFATQYSDQPEQLQTNHVRTNLNETEKE